MKYWLRHWGDRHLSRILFEIRRSRWGQQVRWHWDRITQPTYGRRSLPRWIYLSLAANVVLLLILLQMGIRQYWLHRAVVLMQPSSAASQSFTVSVPSLGTRHQLNYPQWVDLLAQEAQAVAVQKPKHLSVLLGDSISLWFPPDLLLPGRVWLNQGISGENSTGLLQRLDLLDQTEPDTILLMIGINDLLQGVDDETILHNQRQIVQYLKSAHPDAEIVMQSILPHAGEEATWEGRDRLLAIPNHRIQLLNEQLAEIAQEEEIEYLDLYPLFADSQGNLQMNLSTDGLHLNTDGYWVWRSGLQMYFYYAMDARG
ncbi:MULTISPECIES: GDSL-type esterase/lipase family protein [unclassified Leptolyngbya]|uniref:GDSL-type esterase/lipase family protein n=1 Tax=unclassified Leptolyngbya TaxID=2650499 RepID=UPI0018F0036D|nr:MULTISPECIES: GDSL-type esterase/lipase family protein [unclassified Leptolyngbya]